jgi:EAL and modified HD-GYP domain-containing signal transduction protein
MISTPAGRSSSVHPPEIFLGRQPILDRDQRLVAFELLFRSANVQSAGVFDDVHATASVIANTLGAMGVKQVLGDHLAFINFSAELLLSDVVELLPPDRVVLEILETVEIDEKLSRRLLELKKMGFKLALDDVGDTEQVAPDLRGVVDIVKLDLKLIPAEKLARIISHFKRWSVQILAEKIDNPTQAQQCRDLGVDLFQGYYFARPETLKGKRADPSKAALLRLLSQILGDSSIQQLEEELKQHANLTFNLLRVINSAAFGAGRKITSVKQCVVILGRQQLQRWVQLLLYAAGPGQTLGSPLFHTAAVRAMVMERLAAAENAADRAYQDQAFMVGILSLLDVLLGIDMTGVLEELNVADEVRTALLSRGGPVGRLLKLVESKEGNDYAAVEQILSSLKGVSSSTLTEAEVAAVAWADGIARS